MSPIPVVITGVDLSMTGMGKLTRWSAGGHRKFKPAEEFRKPLDPWRPRGDEG